MNLPSSVRIVGRTWRIKVMEPEPEPADGKIQHTGRSEQAKALITVDVTQAPGEVRDTLLHEVLHACVNTIGHEVREGAVHGLAAVLLDALRSNPELVAFLLESEA